MELEGLTINFLGDSITRGHYVADIAMVDSIEIALTVLPKSVSTLIECIGTLKENTPFMRTTFEFLNIPNSMYHGTLTTEKRSDRQCDY